MYTKHDTLCISILDSNKTIILYFFFRKHPKLRNARIPIHRVDAIFDRSKWEKDNDNIYVLDDFSKSLLKDIESHLDVCIDGFTPYYLW